MGPQGPKGPRLIVVPSVLEVPLVPAEGSQAADPAARRGRRSRDCALGVTHEKGGQQRQICIGSALHKSCTAIGQDPQKSAEKSKPSGRNCLVLPGHFRHGLW